MVLFRYFCWKTISRERVFLLNRKGIRYKTSIKIFQLWCYFSFSSLSFFWLKVPVFSKTNKVSSFTENKFFKSEMRGKRILFLRKKCFSSRVLKGVVHSAEKHTQCLCLTEWSLIFPWRLALCPISRLYSVVAPYSSQMPLHSKGENGRSFSLFFFPPWRFFHDGNSPL